MGVWRAKWEHTWPRSTYVLGLDYLTLGQVDDATSEFLAAIELGQKTEMTWMTWNGLGWAYLRRGRLDEAAGGFTKACALGDQGSCSLAQDAANLIRRFRLSKQKQPAPP